MNSVEFEILSKIICFLKYSKKPVSGKKIAEHLNNYSKNKKNHFTDVKVRTYINIIRKKSIEPVIASKTGYYISYDKNEIVKQMHSLGVRTAAMTSALNGLSKFL